MKKPVKRLAARGPEAHRPSRGKATVKELLAVARNVAAHVKEPHQHHADYLYDERGLPK